MAASIAAIPAPTYGKRNSLGIGYGNDKGQNAVALGFKSDLTDSIRLTAALAHSNSEVTSSAGVGWSW
ncbi:MAG: YadA C-terminal domain-containing protein [Desulfuromonadales bacterium]|nr:YadA C-terminal domain-containing protein [Desulfuromonadales bacterium]